MLIVCIRNNNRNNSSDNHNGNTNNNQYIPIIRYKDKRKPKTLT